MSRAATHTPLIQQYLDVKSQNPDAILFFRVGDFYEMFFDDAEEGSRRVLRLGYRRLLMIPN